MFRGLRRERRPGCNWPVQNSNRIYCSYLFDLYYISIRLYAPVCLYIYTPRTTSDTLKKFLVLLSKDLDPQQSRDLKDRKSQKPTSIDLFDPISNTYYSK